MRQAGLVILALAVMLIACSGQAQPSPTSAGSKSPLITASPDPTRVSPVASSESSASPSPSRIGDAKSALDLATRYESARAASRWSEAWALLSAQSQAAIGSLTTFEANERAYNDVGGTVFAVQDPTQDPDLVSNFLGADAPRIAKVADASRGWLVFMRHPDVKAASAGTTGLYVAPLSSGEWRVWIVH